VFFLVEAVGSGLFFLWGESKGVEVSEPGRVQPTNPSSCESKNKKQQKTHAMK
jgi:hypothetical protein